MDLLTFSLLSDVIDKSALSRASVSICMRSAHCKQCHICQHQVHCSCARNECRGPMRRISLEIAANQKQRQHDKSNECWHVDKCKRLKEVARVSHSILFSKLVCEIPVPSD